MKKNTITIELLKWYDENRRDLPWRKNHDPYKIWLSEVILQQTRVDQGLPYFLKFIEKYPKIHDLANAPEDEVLRTWQGLGYYSRARNLHKCAKFISGNQRGKFPQELNELMKLPGIGPYTAAAISSIAFGKKEAVVDGNVIRVITRVFGIEGDINNRKTSNEIKSIVDGLIPKVNPGEFNQAIMEFGAMHCMPKNPNCDTCIFQDLCEARLKGLVEKVPIKSKKIKKRTRFFNYLAIKNHDKFLLKKRTDKDIWNGLFEFFLLETDSENAFDQLVLPESLRAQSVEWELIDESKRYKHLLTHQTIFAKYYIIATSSNFIYNPSDWPHYQLYSIKEIKALPKSILTDRYLGEKIN